MSADPPAVTALAAVGVVCWRDGAVLLIQRARPPRLGEWSIPGGRIEPGETAATAALRELREEASVSAELIAVAAIVDAIDRDPTGRVESHYLIVDYAARWLSGTPTAGDDAAAAAFFSPEDAFSAVACPRTHAVIARSRECLEAGAAAQPLAEGLATSSPSTV